MCALKVLLFTTKKKKAYMLEKKPILGTYGGKKKDALSYSCLYQHCQEVFFHYVKANICHSEE